jgi:predicted lipoprotein with Yx(FWY)xxD motif
VVVTEGDAIRRFPKFSPGKLSLRVRSAVMRGFVLSVATVGALLVTACGSSSSPAAASSPTPAASPTVAEATITVAGTQETILTTLSGMTLYYLTSDVAASPKCAGACLTHWPPLVSATTPVGAAGFSGTFTVVVNANGSQVAYNGHLLYQFANDTVSGDAKGEGIQAFGGTWHVVTAGLAA